MANPACKNTRGKLQHSAQNWGVVGELWRAVVVGVEVEVVVVVVVLMEVEVDAEVEVAVILLTVAVVEVVFVAAKSGTA